MKYVFVSIFIILLILLSWNLVEKDQAAGRNFLKWQHSNFDISSDKAKVRAVDENRGPPAD